MWWHTSFLWASQSGWALSALQRTITVTNKRLGQDVHVSTIKGALEVIRNHHRSLQPSWRQIQGSERTFGSSKIPTETEETPESSASEKQMTAELEKQKLRAEMTRRQMEACQNKKKINLLLQMIHTSWDFSKASVCSCQAFYPKYK